MTVRKLTVPRIMIAGTASGGGKTAVACAVAGALAGKGLSVAPFKCGPDYIDTMFHSAATGRESVNLDLFLSGVNGVLESLAENSNESDIAVIEGVMGFYDGIGGTALASSWETAGACAAPVILVLNARGRALSVAAEAEGFARFMENSVAGFILNGCGEKTFEICAEALEKRVGIKALGFMREIREASFPSRHLGLVTAAETEDLKNKISLLVSEAVNGIDLDGITAIAEKAPPICYAPYEPPEKNILSVGVARDEAFCFRYEDNMKILKKLGADIKYFSPLRDAAPPEGCSGLILGGGYPELYADALGSNGEFIRNIKTLISRGMPVIAECGGFMYLHETLEDSSGRKYPMAGVITGNARMTDKLGPFGYFCLTALKDNPLCPKGDEVRAHEFHYSESDAAADVFSARKPYAGDNADRGMRCVFSDNVLGGYPHFAFRGNERLAENFMSECARFAARACKC